MANPVQNIATQYDKNKFWWLKFYEPGTTTPKTMYTAADEVTSLAKAQINTDGYITTDGTTIFTPHLNGSFDGYLFPTEAEADANDTANAIRVCDNNSGGVSEATAADLAEDEVIEKADLVFKTVADAIAGTDLTGTDISTKLKAFIAANGNLLGTTLEYHAGTGIGGAQQRFTYRSTIRTERVMQGGFLTRTEAITFGVRAEMLNRL